jgi:dihydroneopterin aldolase
MPTDSITLTGLKITSTVGVPPEERRHPQSLEVTVHMCPQQGLSGLNDDIEKTVDYAQVASEIQSIAVAAPRQLIETLAEAIADSLLAAHPLQHITVEVSKFILPHCDRVTVRLHKSSVV